MVWGPIFPTKSALENEILPSYILAVFSFFNLKFCKLVRADVTFKQKKKLKKN